MSSWVGQWNWDNAGGTTGHFSERPQRFAIRAHPVLGLRSKRSGAKARREHTPLGPVLTGEGARKLVFHGEVVRTDRGSCTEPSSALAPVINPDYEVLRDRDKPET